ncbi:MAG: non-homologous end-joining DNA ligase [Methanoregulaceae archaeon]|nr:non-homologous end-joining DNA ligase [Methanoregulaceae archaeon]
MKRDDNGQGEPEMEEQKLGKVVLTNISREMYPELHVTKLDVIEYYLRIAPRILPYLEERALVLQRFPDGVDHPGFYEKDAPAWTPGWVRLYPHHSVSADRELRYVVCDNPDTLIWLANLAALELNIPLARLADPDAPDLLLFDIDPKPPAGFPEAVSVALSLREMLLDLGLVPFVKTSGKKGLHVVIPITGEYRFDETRNFVHAAGALLANESPLVVAELTQTKDPGKVFIDYLQNSAWKTMISPYSLRATGKATVSTPVSWNTLAGRIVPGDFTIRTVYPRGEDPWIHLNTAAERLPEVG